MGEVHVIVGSGAVGTATALELAARGEAVRVVTRRGGGPPAPSVERVAADASDPTALVAACAGARVLYNCANPRYDRWLEDWPPIASALLGAAERTGARLVTASNLYPYAPPEGPLVEGSPLTTSLAKGMVRARIWADALAATEAGRVEATEARASDFFGPRVTDQGHMGERVVPRLLAGKSLLLVGDPDAMHSWTYVPDLARTLVALGESPSAPGRVWHVPTAPPRSAREMVDLLAAAAGVPVPRLRRAPSALLRAAGLVSRDLREVVRVLYQWERPFVIDSSAAQSELGLLPTPPAEAAAATVAWWRERTAQERRGAQRQRRAATTIPATPQIPITSRS